MSKVKLHIAFEMMLFDFNHQNASSSPIMHSICHTCGSLILLEMPDMTPCTSLLDDEWSLSYFFLMSSRCFHFFSLENIVIFNRFF